MSSASSSFSLSAKFLEICDKRDIIIIIMSCVEHLDELVKEYLLFRRFNLTLKSFENEIKSEKEKGYRVEK